MLNIFNNLSTRIKGVARLPEWDYVRDGLTINLNSTKEYYRNGSYAVPSNHELIKLLFGLGVSVDTELSHFYKIVDAKALTVAQQLGFTTSMSRGRIFNNVFFKGDSREVIIVTDELFDPVAVTQNWKDVRPIKVLRHGFDQIDCFPLTGQVESRGISVFAINLPMLAVQYRAYREWQKTYQEVQAGRASIYHFCYSYPINNAIYEAMDHAVFNRMVRIRQGLPTSDNAYQHPYHVTNFTMRCDRLLSMINDSLNSKERDIGNIAMTIPMIDTHNLMQLMKLPDIMETRQINWAMFLARIDVLLFFLSFGQAVKNQNQAEVSRIKYELRRYLNDGAIQSAVPAELYQKQKAVIEQLIATL